MAPLRRASIPACCLEIRWRRGFAPLAQVSYQLKNYDKAIEYGQRAIKGGFADGDIYTLVAQAMYLKGDNKGALAFLNNLVASQERGGQAPKEQTLQLVLSSCIKLKDDPCITSTFEKLVSYYPKDEYWKNLVVSLLNSGANDKTMLQIYRLASDVNAMSGRSYLEMAQIASEAGLPGEAQTAVETAVERKLLTEARDVAAGQRLLATAKTAATSDRASMPKQDADANKGKSGEVDFKVGTAWLSYGQFPQAIAAITRGITKGGLREPRRSPADAWYCQLSCRQQACSHRSLQGSQG